MTDAERIAKLEADIVAIAAKLQRHETYIESIARTLGEITTTLVSYVRRRRDVF